MAPTYTPLPTARPTPTGMPRAAAPSQGPYQTPRPPSYLDFLYERGGASAPSQTSYGPMSQMPPASFEGSQAGADVMSLGGQTMPEVGPTIGNAAALPGETSILANAGEMGAGPLAAIAIGTALAGKAGYDMFKGKRPQGPAGMVGRATLAGATGGLSEVANRLLNGTKSQDQQGRDKGRSAAQKAGYADDQFMTTLADGSKFNIGLDGGTKYKNIGQNIDKKSERNAYDVDFSNPAAVALIPRVKMKVMEILGPNASEKQLSDLTGQFINAATSSGDANKNLDSMFGGTQPQGSNLQDKNWSKGPNTIKGNGQGWGGANGPLVIEQASAPIMIPRSKTRSPGIGLDGKPINYNKR